MEKEVFMFKHFKVSHGRSSMKIGVDAVLLGAWVQGCNPLKILDVGTGCGVIALIMSQRYPEAHILGIDIDEASVKEAGKNFYDNKKDAKMRALQMEFPSDILKYGEKFDLVVSNPPYFRSGLHHLSSPREKARHQGTLSVFSLIHNALKILNPSGHLAIIFPAEFREELINLAKDSNLELFRECKVRNNPNRPIKRIMMEFNIRDVAKLVLPREEVLTLFENGNPTEEYKTLCEDLYLKF